MTLNSKDLETAMKAAETAAIAKNWYGQWFNSVDEYEEWAGDVFQFLFEKACEAVGIFFEEEETYVPDDVIYNDYDNTVTFADSEEFGIPSTCDGDCMECHEPCQMNQDIPDDVDETNYDPYCGCDMYEICGSIDEE